VFPSSELILSEVNFSKQNMNLEQWLSHCETLHNQNIDLGLERVAQVAKTMGLTFTCPVFTVAGTNGKGSTCVMLESILEESGFRTGLYTSPHLFDFRERCRVSREMAEEAQLIAHFERVENARQGQTLTYFEFTTLVILDLLAKANLDAVILEVGLGGRLDAVNVVDADCAVITSIDIDHTEFLGPDRESIGFEKAGIMRHARPVVISDPLPPESVLKHAQSVGADVWLIGRDFNFSGDKQQWSFAARGRRSAGLAYPALRGANQIFNACAALAALEAMRPRLPVTAQGIRNGLSIVELPGRFQIIAGQPTLILDVAHNPHATSALFENLDQMGFYPQTHAVFGVMADKDVLAILGKMKTLVTNWYFCDLPTPRAMRAKDLVQLFRQLSSSNGSAVHSTVDSANSHPDPSSALASAIRQANPADRIVVFGSFYTVGGILKDGIPRLSAPHLKPEDSLQAPIKSTLPVKSIK
jgi:dihydrofolate synthase / folylpolyglutamate synthase